MKKVMLNRNSLSYLSSLVDLNMMKDAVIQGFFGWDGLLEDSPLVTLVHTYLDPAIHQHDSQEVIRFCIIYCNEKTHELW